MVQGSRNLGLGLRAKPTPLTWARVVIEESDFRAQGLRLVCASGRRLKR